MLDSCASATRDSASARTSSCSRTTMRGELGSLCFRWAIVSVIFCLRSREGWTDDWMFRICLSVNRYWS